jgi:hypothetical protein
MKLKIKIVFLLSIQLMLINCGINNPSQYIETPSSQSQLETITIDQITPSPEFILATDNPSLSVANTVQRLLDFSDTECKLPCLWGITPGKQVNDLDEFIGVIRKSTKEKGEIYDSNNYLSISDYDQIGGATLAHLMGEVMINVHFSYYKNVDQTNLDVLAMHSYARILVNKDDNWRNVAELPAYESVIFQDIFKTMTLPVIFKEYGQPAQILLATWRDNPNRPDITFQPFSLILYYPEQGFLVEYVSPRETTDNGYAGCPSKGEIYLTTWDVSADLDFEYVVQKGGGVINELNIDYYRPLEDATNLTKELFYSSVISSQDDLCIETFPDIWHEG